MQEVPRLLNEISAHRQRAEWHLGLPNMAEPMLEDEVSPWRRFVFSARRRVARFLAQTVLFEEFAALNAALSTVSAKFAELAELSVTLQRIEQTLYESQTDSVTRPREIFVMGSKSPATPETRA